MTGINAIIYILSTIPPYALLSSISLFCSHPGFSWYLVDRWGRRIILLSGAVIVRTVVVAWF